MTEFDEVEYAGIEEFSEPLRRIIWARVDRIEMDIEFERFRIDCIDQRVLARLWWKGYLFGSGSHIQWDYMKDSPRLSFNFGKLDDESLCREALDTLGWYLTTKTPAERTAWTEGFLDGAMSGRKRIHAG